MSDRNGIDRRTTLKAMAAGAIAGAASTPAAAADSNARLEEAFRAAFDTAAAAPGNSATRRLAFLADPALVIESDVPFPLDRTGYADHLGFHAGNWQRLELKLHELKTTVHGDTGIVSAYFLQRGKPRDAGFRLRAGYCTAVCARADGKWRAIGLHFGALNGQITDASPG